MLVGLRLRCWLAAGSAAVLLLMTAGPATALINPKFTPVDLVTQANVILRMNVSRGEDGLVKAESLLALKGQSPAKLVLSGARLAGDAAKVWDDTVGPQPRCALVFLGDFSEARSEAAAGDAPVGALLVGVHWFALRKAGDEYQLDGDVLDIKAVWAGGPLMLERAIEYINTDARADVPVRVGVTWASDQKLGVFQGPTQLAAFWFSGQSRPCLLCMSASGDRLFQADADGKLADVTAKFGLKASSCAAACGDFNDDGQLDMALTDGKRIQLLLLSADGGEMQTLDVNLPDTCIGLATVAVDGRAALLASTRSVPVVVARATDGQWKATPLPAAGDASGVHQPPEISAAGARPCLVGDFDGDGVADILQPRPDGLYFYKGRAGGQFAAPHLAVKAKLGAGGSAIAGDFDGDGQLDVIVPRNPCCAVLVNVGGGKFRDVLHEAGEVDTNSAQIENTAAAWCDLNSDGRQDFILFSPKLGFQPYFNRGFRCFGFAAEIEPKNTALPAAEAALAGQQAGVLADFNGDGGQDLAIVTANGELWVLWRSMGPKDSKCAATVFAPDGTGPVTVLGYDGPRPLGAQLIAPGSPGFFCRKTKGPLKLQGQTPAGEAKTMQAVLLQPTRVQLP